MHLILSIKRPLSMKSGHYLCLRPFHRLLFLSSGWLNFKVGVCGRNRRVLEVYVVFINVKYVLK